MQTVGTVKGEWGSGGNFMEKRKAQSYAKTWGILVGGAVVGAVTVNATAHSILALLGLLASPPVAVTVGMLSGGLLGWRYMQQQEENASSTVPTAISLMPMDDLEQINGITAIYADRLHAAGVNTFAHLAALTPERIHLIIGPTYYDNLIQSERWIADARYLAEYSKAKAFA